MPGSLSSTSTARIAGQSRQVMRKRMRHQDPRPKQDGIRRPPNGRGKDPGHQLPEKNDPSGATRGNKKCTTSTDGNKKVNQAILLPFLSVFFFQPPFPPLVSVWISVCMSSRPGFGLLVFAYVTRRLSLVSPHPYLQSSNYGRTERDSILRLHRRPGVCVASVSHRSYG
jgi:hypothetical protein